jgi:cell growth-regulating nucleolar protein
MVYFDCSCGESLKKPAVAKHLERWNCPHVTCIDCSKVFHGREYDTHNKCISEAQKYMGALYKEDATKKEGAKQDSWIESVSAALSNYQGPLRHHVDRLAAYDNIPRKKKAFDNFVANSLNLKRDMATVEKLWLIIEPCTRSVGAGNGGKSLPEWSGYEAECEEILRRNGGSMGWKILTSKLTQKRKSCFPNEKIEEIKLQCLSNIPKQFLNEKNNLVRLE